MVEETPSRMSTVGAYRILNDDTDDDMEISPVLLRESSASNNITIDDEYSRRISFRNRSSLQAIDDDDDDSDYMQHFTFSQEPAEINGLNCLNFVTFLLHLFVTSGIGLWGLGGILPTIWVVHVKYETLVTPAAWAHWIWIPILVGESIFGVAQLLPSLRARPILQDGTGFFFFYTCLLQTAYTISFSFHVFIASFVLAVATFLSCAYTLVRQYYSQNTRSEYWLFKLPFLLHCGWMLIMVVVNASMLCSKYTGSVSTQLSVDVVGLSMLVPIALVLLWFLSVTDFVVPCIIIYYYIAIVCRLHSPSEELMNEYGKTIINTVQLTALIFNVIVAVLALPRLVISIGHKFLTIQVVTMQEDSLTLE